MAIFYALSSVLFMIRTIADRSGNSVSNDLNVIATVVSVGMCLHQILN